MTLRQELQAYFDRVYTHSKIDTEHTVGGKVQIRFELGGDLRNGSKKRVAQSAKRALALFNDTFAACNNQIFVLIYEYECGFMGKAGSNEYLDRLFPTEAFATFYNECEIVNTRHFTTDTNGNAILAQQEVRVIVGKLPVKDIDAKAILTGIANLEMGFEPAVEQTIMFFDPLTDKGFYMYDDRGCYVWSDDAEKIRGIYIARSEWIADYHRSEIDEYFLS